MKFNLNNMGWLATDLGQNLNGYQLMSDSHTGAVYLIDYGHGQKVVCKHDYKFQPTKNKEGNVNTSSLVSSEAHSLLYLKKNTILAVPHVISTHSSYLILNHIEQKKLNKRSELAAYDISNLHSQSHSNFGFEQNNYIAGISQNNEWNSSWVDFYATQRLAPIAKHLQNKQIIGKRFLDRIHLLCEKLDDYIPNKPKPSLLHGDLWAGNILSSSEEKLVYIDPAPYYGHFEMEIAFLLMFQTFNQDFYSIYNSFFRLDNDFYNTRVSLYQMYPQMVHAYLYDDASYLHPIHKTLEKLGF
ncbi:MAG: fructosamine kinase family protein [Candidatus Cloacimonetes bacterium]|nr:fructosamine kinase family protein [Candidatus Cloacimonadota bacterium]